MENEEDCDVKMEKKHDLNSEYFLISAHMSSQRLKEGLTDMGFLGPMLIPMLGSKEILIYDTSTTISAQCSYHILVRIICDICNGFRVSFILTHFIPNISALNTKLNYLTSLCWTNYIITPF